MRKTLLKIAVAILAFTLPVAVVNTSYALAAEPEETIEVEQISSTTLTWLENEFVMDYGASVRVGKEVVGENGQKTYERYGIRFSASATTESGLKAFQNIYNSDAISGVLIAPHSTVSSVMNSANITDKNLLLTPKTVFEENLFVFAQQGQAWTDNTIYNVTAKVQDSDGDLNADVLHGSVVNLNVHNFLQKYTGVAYVGVPENYNEDGSVASYKYYFAKYASYTDPITREEGGNDFSNNTRCMYYIAQKAIENEDELASVLKTTYIDAFKSAYPDVVNKQQFKYTTVHHYVNEDGSEDREIVYKGATFANNGVGSDKALTAETKEKTEGDKKFVVDTAKTGLLNRSYLYAGSMTYLHVYYTEKSLREENQKRTNELVYNIMRNDTSKYFDGSIKVNGSQNAPTIDSVASWTSGQKTLTFTKDFVSTLQDEGFTKVYIEKAVIQVNIISSGWSPSVDKIVVSGCINATLDANVIGYTTESYLWGQYVIITFTGITIELPTEAADEDFVLTAMDGDSSIKGTWTLSGVLFG